MSISDAERAAAAALMGCWRREVEDADANNTVALRGEAGGVETLLAKAAPKKAVEAF